METSTSRPTFVNESDMELYATSPHIDETRATESEFSLPPVDGGKDAWLFVFSAFVLEILVWGKYFRLARTQTSSTSTLLTIHRVSFRFRYIPRILLIKPTLCRLPKYTHYRDLRHGPNVPCYATRFRFVCVVSWCSTSMHHDWADHHVSFLGTELVEPDCSASNCHPGSFLCNWGCTLL
jgi:hypothetical protein